MKPDVSIVIANYNQKETIRQAIASSIGQKGFRTEVLVADDQSTQKEVLEIYKKFGKKIILVQSERKGRIPLLNKAIRSARADFVCISAGDCIMEPEFLKKIMRFFGSERRIAFVSPFSETGGNCTVYRKKVLEEVKGFSEEYSDGKTGFRDDTDLVFRIWDKGYESVFNYVPKFKHEHKTPQAFLKKISYAWGRVKIHRFDALLLKKHPKRAAKFFDVRLGFLRNPLTRPRSAL